MSRFNEVLNKKAVAISYDERKNAAPVIVASGMGYLAEKMVELAQEWRSDKAMRKLDKGVAARVFDELDEIAKLEDPRSRGKALTGNLAGVWRYRVGDYRILCDINDGRLVILVVDVAHRREVYKRR